MQSHITRGSGGNTSPPPPPRKPEKCKKMDAFPFLYEIIHTRRVDSYVMMWIQIRARGVQGYTSPIFLLKWYKLAQSECSKIHYYEPKNQQF